MQVALHSGQLQQLDRLSEVLQFGAAAAALSAAASANSISAERALEAAAILSSRIMRSWEDAAAKYDEARLDRTPAAAVLGTCMEKIASTAVASAATMAQSGGSWTQEAAGHLLTAVTRLSAWLLTPHAAVHGALAATAQQHLAPLLSCDGPTSSAAQAADPAFRTRLAVALASYTGRAVHLWQRSSLEMLPLLALSMRAVRILRGGGNSGGGDQRGCLRTECSIQILRTEVMEFAAMCMHSRRVVLAGRIWLGC